MARRAGKHPAAGGAHLNTMRVMSARISSISAHVI